MLTDGQTDGQKIGRLYRTLLQAGAIKSKYHNESTASERSVMNYSGACVYVCVGVGGAEGVKLALLDPNPRSHLPWW